MGLGWNPTVDMDGSLGLVEYRALYGANKVWKKEIDIRVINSIDLRQSCTRMQNQFFLFCSGLVWSIEEANKKRHQRCR